MFDRVSHTSLQFKVKQNLRLVVPPWLIDMIRY